MGEDRGGPGPDRDLLEATLSQLLDGIVVVDLEGKLRFLNRAAEQMLGMPVRGLAPDQWTSHFGIYRADGVTPVPPAENPLRLSLSGAESREVELVLRNPARPEPRRMRVTASPLRGPDGVIRGGISLFRDVTDRHREEEERRSRLSALLELTRRSLSGPEQLPAELKVLARGAAAALGVERAGVWRFTPDRSAIRCEALFDLRDPEGAELRTLPDERYPAYLTAILESKVVDAADGAADRRTSELRADYLEPLGIRALLDAPIHVRGELDGILCHEHRGGVREWTSEEKTVAVALASLAGQAIAEADRQRLRSELRASEEARIQKEERTGSRTRMDGLLGRSAAITAAFRRLRLAADGDVTVLLTGESGTGKELAAAAIHAFSARKRGPFVALNCSALSETLLESELFGHVKGAFTGADRDRTGLFQAAQGGTLFLDEVGDLPPALQVRVLRALQEREIRRVGEERTTAVDVRIITATHWKLDELVAQGKMREDFYYRIRVFEIEMPPLRERREDIPLLAAQFIREFARSTGKRIKTITPAAMRILLNYRWPGNVRELRNAVEHAFVLAKGSMLMLQDFPDHLRPRPGVKASRPRSAPTESDQRERQRILRALEREGGNRQRAARALGISRVTLWHWMKHFGIEV